MGLLNRRLIGAGLAVAAALAASAAAAPVVASDRVAIRAQRTVADPRQPPLTVFGSVSSGRADELVTVQAKDCGQPAFRNVGVAYTLAGGGWSTSLLTRISRTVRAVWKDAVSAEITLRARALVVLDRLSTNRFEVGVGALTQFWHRRVVIQRLNHRLGTWTTLRTVVLTETFGSAPVAGAPPGPGGGIWTSATFRASFPKGTVLRAGLPSSQARPCYLAGVSNLVRT